jgi:hypothetical protein
LSVEADFRKISCEECPQELCDENRQSAAADARAQADYEVNVKAESEIAPWCC